MERKTHKHCFSGIQTNGEKTPKTPISFVIYYLQLRSKRKPAEELMISCHPIRHGQSGLRQQLLLWFPLRHHKPGTSIASLLSHERMNRTENWHLDLTHRSQTAYPEASQARWPHPKGETRAEAELLLSPRQAECAQWRRAVEPH